MEKKGFSPKFIGWIMQTIERGKVAVMVNDQIGPFLRHKKGLRQGDPLSPILFNIAIDILNLLLVRAQELGLIKSLVHDLIPNGINMLQYADDTIFMFKDDLESARNLKLILCLFEQLSGLKVNFHKSGVFCFGEARDKQDSYSNIFTCVVGKVPFKYLGIPINAVRLCNSDWNSPEEKMEKKLSVWKGRHRSYGGRLILISFNLSNVPLYMISLFELPKGPSKRMNFYMRRMLWQEEENVKKNTI